MCMYIKISSHFKEDLRGEFPGDEYNWLSSVFMNEGDRKLSIAI